MDAIIAVLLGILLYTVICLIIALVRALFSKSEKRKQNFKGLFWSFFLEILNPLNWLS